MTDETMTHADIEQETPAIDEHEDTEVETPEELDTEDAQDDSEEAEADGSDEQEQEEPDVEFATVEFNGKQYQVPKDLEAGFMMNADYTRKTQETAAFKRELEQREAALSQKSQASEQELQARAALFNIDQQLNQYRQMTPQEWRQLEQEDPWSFQNHRTNMLQLEGNRRQIGEILTQHEQQRTEEARQSQAKRLQETRLFAEKEIPGWSPEVDAKVTNFATSELGFERDTLLEAYNPQIYRALYLAFLGSQTLKKPAAKPAAPKTPQKPLSKVGSKGNPPARKSIEDMSMDEYATYMNKREATRAKR